MDIRPASTADADIVARLIAEFRDWWSKSEPPEDAIRAGVERIIEAGDGEYLVATVKGEPAGVSQLRFRWSVWTSAEDCWLEDLFVRADARGAGVGRALVEACFERARERGCKRIELDTNEDNEAAIALYEACGFSTRPKGPSRTLFLSRKL